MGHVMCGPHIASPNCMSIQESLLQRHNILACATPTISLLLIERMRYVFRSIPGTCADKLSPWMDFLGIHVCSTEL